jgi:hypothetical protein
MFVSTKKILINGCGITFGSENIKSWPKILSLLGKSIVNISAPAISNQWIVDRTAEYLLKNTDANQVIIQLTSINKLDVEINTIEKEKLLVAPDTLRNFVWQGVWPSSGSTEHLSKRLYHEYLYSPTLLTKELSVKIAMLDFWCQSHNIKLHVYQGYTIPWTSDDLELISGIVKNINNPWYQHYKMSNKYQYHDYTNKNTVPCIEYAFELAEIMAVELGLNSKKIAELYQLYTHKHKSSGINTVNMV